MISMIRTCLRVVASEYHKPRLHTRDRFGQKILEYAGAVPISHMTVPDHRKTDNLGFS
ncbi:hypothetical protein D3C79_1006620 [compost metagenome]